MVPHKSCFKEEITGAKVINPKKLSWVRVPVKMVYVARKLNTAEKRRQVQNCLLQRGDYSTGHSPEKLSTVLSPSEDGFCSLETKHDRRMVPRPKLFVSARRLQDYKPKKGICPEFKLR
jgi:hypothetical protein